MRIRGLCPDLHPKASFLKRPGAPNLQSPGATPEPHTCPPPGAVGTAPRALAPQGLKD